MRDRYRFSHLLCLSLILLLTPQIGVAQTISPGGAEEILAISQACPTFSWGLQDVRGGHELVVYRLEDRASSDASSSDPPALRVQLPAGASSWTPSLGDCLEEGESYFWTVRAFGEEDMGDWAEPRRFEVATVVTEERVTEALRTLRLYLAQQGALGVSPGTSDSDDDTGPPPATAVTLDAGSSASPMPAPAVSGAAGLRAVSPGSAGSVFGIFGISESVDGAGIVASNSAGGADLILDDTTNPAALTETFFDRSSASDLSFDFRNSGLGNLHLSVDGSLAWTAGNDGTGSGLDADFLDGLSAGSFASSSDLAAHKNSSDHDGRYLENTFDTVQGELSFKDPDIRIFSSDGTHLEVRAESTEFSDIDLISSDDIDLDAADDVELDAGDDILMFPGANGDVKVDGAIVHSSDKNKKHSLVAIPEKNILQAVAELPIYEWSFKGDERGTRHIGPTAQDFHRLFRVGHDERFISTVDADGVALGAIQGLYELVQEQREEIGQLRQKVREMEERFDLVTP